jgi:hypothetical protein
MSYNIFDEVEQDLGLREYEYLVPFAFELLHELTQKLHLVGCAYPLFGFFDLERLFDPFFDVPETELCGEHTFLLRGFLPLFLLR